MKKIYFLFFCCICFLTFFEFRLYGQKNNDYKTLSVGFKDPPASARPYVYHWWLGGDVDTVRLKEEIRSFKKAGISGFTIFEIGSRDTAYIKAGPAFLGKESLAFIKYAVDEAGRLGMTVGLNTASSWNAGGSWITPEYAAKSIYESILKVTDESKPRNKLPFPKIPEKDAWGKERLIEYRKDGKPVYYREVAVLAVPVTATKASLDTGRIINVTGFFNPETGILNWRAPAGEWEIHRYICSNSGENLVLPSIHSAGPIIDHYDAASTEFHFMYIINKLESVFGDLRKTALKSLYMASYEAKGFTWTITLPEVFKKINGYDIDKFIPALFDEHTFPPEVYAEFMADFQRTLSELMINNFYKKSKEICNAHGLKNNSEAGGPGLPIHHVPVEPLKALGSLDIPRGEFWINHHRFNDQGVDILRVVKEVSAASHIYNQGIVEMEAFTSFQQWQEGPFDMKPFGDRAFCEGMNKVVVHGSTHNPAGTGVPGIVYNAGTHYNDKRIWWPKIKPFNDYLARISYILQETNFVADLLYYYGDTIPNYGGHKNGRFTAGPGYDYEIINAEKLKDLTVKNNKLYLPGTNVEYSILVLSNENKIDPDILLKLKELSNQGAVILGTKPEGIMRRQTGPELKDPSGLIDQLWKNSGNPVFSPDLTGIKEGFKPSEVLESLGVIPDFRYPGSPYFTLDYIHYARSDLDFYFIRNTTGEWISRNCQFRQQDKIPEMWDPVSGDIIAVSIYNQVNQAISIPISLGPYESRFIVFRPGNPHFHYTELDDNQLRLPLLAYTRQGICFWENGVFHLKSSDGNKDIDNLVDVQPVNGAWEVYFPKGWGMPERVIFPRLKSWTDSDIEGLKYFSGIATYKKTFQYPVNSNALEEEKIYLDLGDLSKIGDVWLNDRHLGIAWTKPYRFDITGLLKPGDNILVVEIANTWSNRLAGDAVTGENYTSTNIKATNVYGLNQVEVPWDEVPLIRSGLFGPVKLVTIKPVE